INLCFQSRLGGIKRFMVQRLSSRSVNPMKSMAKGKSAKRLTLNFESRFQRETLNPDRDDVKLICNAVGYIVLQSFVLCE
ncbi:MAG: hypothetical protein U9R17_04565, partial [Thermodesulfobacteriota bacterium]|nr:hypothetical protein [Thermodesulfobacteriota bacterium]